MKSYAYKSTSVNWAKSQSAIFVIIGLYELVHGQNQFWQLLGAANVVLWSEEIYSAWR